MYNNSSQWNPQFGYSPLPEEEEKAPGLFDQVYGRLNGGRGDLVAQNSLDTVPQMPKNIDGGTFNKTEFGKQADSLINPKSSEFGTRVTETYPNGKPQTSTPSVTSSQPFMGSTTSTPQDTTTPKLNVIEGAAAATPKTPPTVTEKIESGTTPLTDVPPAPVTPTATPTAAPAAPAVPELNTPPPTLPGFGLERDVSTPYWKAGKVFRDGKGGMTYLDPATGKKQAISKQELDNIGIKLPQHIDAPFMQKVGIGLKKYRPISKPAPTAPTATTGAAPESTELKAPAIPAATVARTGIKGELATTKGSSAAKTADSTTTTTVDPKLAEKGEQAYGKYDLEMQKFSNAMDKYLDPDGKEASRSLAIKNAALNQYHQSMSNERKAQMWDGIIRGLGKATAGAVGLHGLGIGGKSIIKPGLDVAKYYDPGEAYNPKAGQDQAKTIFESKLKHADDVKADVARTVGVLKLRLEAMNPKDRMDYLARLMELSKETSTTSEAQEVGAETGIAPDQFAIAGAGRQPTTKDDKSQAIGTGDVDAFNKSNQARIAKQNSAVTTNINNEETAVQSLASSNESVPTDGLRTMWQEEFAKVQDPKKAADAVQGKLRALYNVPTDTNSKEYALWYFDVYQPMAAYGANIGLPSDRGILKTTSGSRSYDYIPDRNEYSEYSKIYAQTKGTEGQRRQQTLKILREQMEEMKNPAPKNPAAPATNLGEQVKSSLKGRKESKLPAVTPATKPK